MTVGMAFKEFAIQKVDIAIIEVGLGGRLDSTNIITPEVSVITNIGLDHTQFLGETLSEIAFEKAGIIKKDVPIIIGERQEEVIPVFKKKANLCSIELIFASDDPTRYKTDLLGEYQLHNSRTAVQTIKQLNGYKVSEKNIENGLLRVVQNTNLKGRWQLLQDSPKIICDTAHNKEGLQYTLRQLKKEKYQQLHILLGVVSDKKLDEILLMFPKEAIYYFCKPNIPRGLSEMKLWEEAKKNGLEGKYYDSVKEAYKLLTMNMKKNDLAYVGGSTFVVAEIL